MQIKAQHHIFFILLVIFTVGINDRAYASQLINLNFNANINLNEMNGKQIVNGVNVMTVQAPRNPSSSIMFGTPSVSHITAQNIMALDTGVENLYVSIGYRINGADYYTNPYKDINIEIPVDGSNTVTFLASFLTKGTVLPEPGEYNVDELLGFNYDRENQYKYYLYLKGHVVVTAATCAISSSNNISILWPSLSAADIINNTAEEKIAPVTVDCDGSSNIAPMQITFTSSEGSSDGPNGVVKTTANNLGLKLSWAADHGAIPMDPVISVPTPTNGGTKDISVVAKPVHIGSGNIAAGDFSSLVNIFIEYH